MARSFHLSFKRVSLTDKTLWRRIWREALETINIFYVDTTSEGKDMFRLGGRKWWNNYGTVYMNTKVMGDSALVNFDIICNAETTSEYSIESEIEQIQSFVLRVFNEKTGVKGKGKELEMGFDNGIYEDICKHKGHSFVNFADRKGYVICKKCGMMIKSGIKTVSKKKIRHLNKGERP